MMETASVVPSQTMPCSVLPELMRVPEPCKVVHTVFQAPVQWFSPNKALQPTAAAVLVCQGHESPLAAAAAELGR
jgi:hypothetical protein